MEGTGAEKRQKTARKRISLRWSLSQGGRCILADDIFTFLFGFSLGNYFESFEMSHFQLSITNNKYKLEK